MSTNPDDGLLIVDKPPGMTSHDVVSRVRRLAGTRRVGHAGTLDPMATGVLVIGVNRATRLLTYIVGADKEYLATIVLGVATTTDDADGEITATVPAGVLDPALIATEVAHLTGEIQQVPSSVSAIKVNGVRAYAKARAGEAVQLAARTVQVPEFEVLAARSLPQTTELDVRVVCSSGTYIRALARDLGAALGVGGHLNALRRTRVGGYRIDDASTLDQLATSTEPIPLIEMATAAAAVMPRRDLTDSETTDLGYGRPLVPTGTPGPVAAVTRDGRLAAVLVDGTFHGEPKAKPDIVLL